MKRIVLLLGIAVLLATPARAQRVINGHLSGKAFQSSITLNDTGNQQFNLVCAVNKMPTVTQVCISNSNGFLSYKAGGGAPQVIATYQPGCTLYFPGLPIPNGFVQNDFFCNSVYGPVTCTVNGICISP